MAIYWICFSLLPQFILVNLKLFSKVMHSFGVFYTFSIFQAFGVLIMSIGLKRTVKTIIKFPPIILTPIFSIWTIGSVMSTTFVCGSNGHQNLGVSICLTWINLLLTFASGLAYNIWSDYSNVIRWNDPVWYIFRGFIRSTCPCLAIAMIFLILLQCLDKCSDCCCPCIPCCESNCYPVTQLTYLDVDNMDVIITQEEIDLEQF